MRTGISVAESAASDEEKFLAIFDVLDKVVRSSFLRIPKRAHVLDWMAEQTRKLIIGTGRIGFLRGTGYRRYVRKVNDLLVGILGKANAPLVSRAQEGFLFSPDGRVVVQSSVHELGSQIGKLHELRQRNLTYRGVNSICEMYRKLAGHYEKLICVQLATASATTEVPTEYGAFRKRRLAANLDTLRKAGLSELADAFDLTVRNAIAHGNIVLLFSSRRIQFVDLSKHQELTVSVLITKTKELAAVVVAMLQAFPLLWHYTFVCLARARNLILEGMTIKEITERSPSRWKTGKA